MMRHSLALGVIFLSALVLNSLTLVNGHNWGGDFAQYILHARNLINHAPYTAGIMLEQGIVYPPGFPLLLAPFIKWFGVNFLILKALNIVFWFAAAFCIYQLTKKYTTVTYALLSTTLFCFSSVFFTFKQNILSDVPFVFFILASLYAFDSRRLMWALIFLSSAILCRSAGMVLSMAAIIFFLGIQRNVRIAVMIVLTTAATLVFQYAITQGFHPGFFKALTQMDLLNALKNFSSTTWKSLIWFYVPGQIPITSALFLAGSVIMLFLSPLLWIGLGVLTVQRIRKQQITFIELFCYLYFGILLCWSLWGDSPQNFNRFLFPIVGLLPIIAFQLAKNIRQQQVLQWVLAGFICINMINISEIFKFNDDELMRPYNQTLFGWIETQTPKKSHFMKWEPRTITLMTDRIGTTLAWLAFQAPSEWHTISQQMGVNFFIFDRGRDTGFIQTFKQLPWTRQIWSNEQYIIFQKYH